MCNPLSVFYVNGGIFLSDKYKELLDQYDVKILSTFRNRGTFQCETEQGLALLKEYHGSLQKLALEYEWKEKLAEAGFLSTDRYFLTRENSLLSFDRYHTPFVLKHYFNGRECDCSSLCDVESACRNLGLLHNISSSIPETPFEHLKNESIAHRFSRKNRELRTVRKYISQLNGKKEFELLYIKYFSLFYEEAVHALQLLNEISSPLLPADCGVCHGAYHYHNVLILPDHSVATVNFEAFCYQPYLLDLYLFLRKTLEKNQYDYTFFEAGISGYSSCRPLSEQDFIFLYLLFLYPEKFWKISNQYYNHRKSWISPRILEKMQKVLEQNGKRHIFLDRFSRFLSHSSCRVY